MTPVAVIILNWNGVSMLRRFLPEVLATTDEAVARVIVADNGSSDESLRVLAEEFPSVEVIRLEKNYGFAEGYNRAISQVGNDYVVLLNSDVATSAGWVNALLRYMDENPRCAACQPKILYSEDRSMFEYAGAAGGFVDRNGYPYCRGRIFSTVEPDNGQYDNAIHVDWATGAALMVRRDLYIGVGGLDPLFFAHMEEIDLCWRLRTAGYTIDVVPSSTVYHLGGGSLPAGNPRKTYLNFRNNLLLLYKNLPTQIRDSKIFKRKMLDGIAALKFLLSFQFKNFIAVAKAHRDFNRMKRNYSSIPDVEPVVPVRRPNILIEYYLKRHKKYSQIHKNVAE